MSVRSHVRKSIPLLYAVLVFLRDLKNAAKVYVFLKRSKRTIITSGDLKKRFSEKRNVSILASGDSVLAKQDVEFGDEHTLKIAFNFWVIHDVVPDVYLIELKPEELETSLPQFKLFDEKRKTYRNVVFIMKGLEAKTTSQMEKILNFIDTHFPQALKGNLYFLLSVATVLENPVATIHSMNGYLFLKRSLNKFGIFLGCRGTIVLALSLALLFEKKTKVFGFDLTVDHFYNTYSSRLGYKNPLPDNRHTGLVRHKTSDPKFGLPTVTFLVGYLLKTTMLGHQAEFLGRVDCAMLLDLHEKELCGDAG